MATTSTPPPVNVLGLPSEKSNSKPQELSANPPSPNNDHNQRPPFINTVAELRGLATALSTFQRRYDDLQGHLDYIRNSIDSKLPKEITTIPLPKQSLVSSSTETPSLINHNSILPKEISTIPQYKQALVSSTETPSPSDSKLPNTIPLHNSEDSKLLSTIPLHKQALVSSTETPSPNNAAANPNEENPNSMNSTLEALCVQMCGRGLRKYISTQLSNKRKLREEVPKALKCAPNPAKLVLDSIGRFYVQGKNAYGKDSKMSAIRAASVLILECFLRMERDGVKIEPQVKQEADIAAEAWRKRLKDEGGIPKACELDARGLLFLISGFGVPRDFKHEPLRDVIRASNPNGIYNVLCRSSDLISRIPGVLERMVRDQKHLGAVNMAYTFELENFQLPVLKVFLRDMENVWIKARDRGAYTPLAVLNKANKIWVNNMRSVVLCLKQKGLDHSKLVPEWKLDEKILGLEKEITEIDKEIKEKETEETAKPKRKADKTEPSKKSKAPKVKHSQQTGKAPQQQKAPAYADRRSVYDLPTQINHLDGGFPAHINGYSASPHGLMTNHSSQLYGWHGGAALSERLVGPSFEGQPSSVGFNDTYRRPSPPLEGFAGMPDQHQSFEGFAGLPDQHRSFEGFAGLPDQRSLEGFAGLPDQRSFEGFAGLPDQQRSERVLGRSSASDLYQFADSVLEMESNRNGGSSRVGGGTTVPAHHKYNL